MDKLIDDVGAAMRACDRECNKAMDLLETNASADEKLDAIQHGKLHTKIRYTLSRLQGYLLDKKAGILDRKPTDSWLELGDDFPF